MKDTRDKENALIDFMNMITKSWTWERMTSEEQNRCDEALHQAHLHGRYLQRYETLNDIYLSFLLALDYKPIGWRDKNKGENPAF